MELALQGRGERAGTSVKGTGTVVAYLGKGKLDPYEGKDFKIGGWEPRRSCWRKRRETSSSGSGEATRSGPQERGCSRVVRVAAGLERVKN